MNYSKPIEKSDFVKNIDFTNEEIKMLENQVQQITESLEKLSLQKENGIISEQDYTEMYDFYNAKIRKIENESEEIRCQKIRLLKCADEIRNQYEKYFSATELNRSMLVTFIEKIEVFSKTKIKIYFRYEDIFNTGGEISGS